VLVGVSSAVSEQPPSAARRGNDYTILGFALEFVAGYLAFRARRGRTSFDIARELSKLYQVRSDIHSRFEGYSEFASVLDSGPVPGVIRSTF